MPPAKKQKIDRESTAAYIASQPLFDALRKATMALPEQKSLLKTAGDTVQALHVKVVNDDMTKHQAYLEHIRASWASAIQNYGEIFHQIALITAPEISQGRPAARTHEGYTAILDTITKAKEAVETFRSSSEQAEEASEEETINKKPVSDASSDSPPAVESSKSAPLKRSFAGDDSAEEGASKTQKLDGSTPTTSTDAQREKKLAKNNAKARRKKALKKATATAESAANEQEEAQPVTSDIPEVIASATPIVEFEDVQAEVDARLKVKADRYAAKKERRAGEKKRKRESVDSLAKVEDEETAKIEPEPESKPSAIEEQVKKPKKKKVKKAHSKVADPDDATAFKTEAPPVEQKADITAGTNANTKAPKRKPDVAAAAVGGGGGKKRKTNHAAKK